MTDFDKWPVWKLALAVNVLGAVGVALGFALTDVKLSPEYRIPIAVFALAFLNFMFLVLRPRSLVAKSEGSTRVSALPLLVNVVRERPLILTLVVLQLLGVSRSATAAFTFLQVLNGGYVRGLPNASAVGFRLVAMSAAMTVVAGIWLASVVGLWCSRPWAWWLALALNGLAASVSGILQLLVWHSYLLDTGAIAALVLLMLPAVRNETGDIRRQVQPA